MNKIKNKKIKLSEDFMETDIECTTYEEAIKILAENLIKNKYVKECFCEKVLGREKSFPTGLKTRSIGIAIPHTEPEFVNESTIAVGILKNPVIFHEMANEKEKVQVRIVFLLALNDSNKHLNILSDVIKIVKDDEVLNSMLNMSKSEIVKLLDKYLI